jgi:hypothetical protein
LTGTGDAPGRLLLASGSSGLVTLPLQRVAPLSEPSSPGLVRTARGGKAGNLERGSRGRKTKAGCASAIRRGPRKVVGGGGVDQRRHHGARSRTRRRKSSGGDRAGHGLNNRGSQRILARSKALQAGAAILAPVATPAGSTDQPARGPRRVTSPYGCARGKTPGERIPDVVVG